jgi:hypothetical protein
LLFISTELGIIEGETYHNTQIDETPISNSKYKRLQAEEEILQQQMEEREAEVSSIHLRTQQFYYS